MKLKIYLTIILLIMVQCSYSQKVRLSKALDAKNGWQDIKLGSDISEYPDFVTYDDLMRDTSQAGLANSIFKKCNLTGECDYIYTGLKYFFSTEMKPTVVVNTYHGKIRSIRLFTMFSQSHISALIENYGVASEDYQCTKPKKSCITYGTGMNQTAFGFWRGANVLLQVSGIYSYSNNINIMEICYSSLELQRKFIEEQNARQKQRNKNDY